MLRRLLFNIWYLFNPPWDTEITPPELMKYIEEHHPGRALDIGCGTGTNVITLAKHGWKAVGIDFASLAIITARRKAKKAGVEVKFYVDDVTDLNKVSGLFDLILDIGCYHSILESDRHDYLSQLYDLLPEKGDYMLYAFLKSGSEEEVSGITEREISMISSRLDLIERKDGSERGIRPSTWLTFRNT